jgi:hypothetical protein
VLRSRRNFFVEGTIVATVVGNLIASCTSTSGTKLPAYQPPARSAQAVEIINAGGSGHVWSIDGAETPAFSRSIRVAPGEPPNWRQLPFR